MEWGQQWKVINDKNKKTLRVSSYESDANVCRGAEKLPFDIEIFQNLVSNINRKFDVENGENLLCFGGCAIFNTDGSLKCVESFLPKYPSIIKNLLSINKSAVKGFSDSREEKPSLTDAEIRKSIWESVAESRQEGESLDSVRIEPSFVSAGGGEESHFLVSLPSKPHQDAKQVFCLSPTDSSNSFKSSQQFSNSVEFQEEESESTDNKLSTIVDSVVDGRKRKIPKFKMKYGSPVPPRPVLSLSQADLKLWFPQFLEKMSGKKFPTSMPKKFPDWDTDVDKVLTMKDFVEFGPKNEFNWNKVSPNFFWKLKLVSAIILDKKGIDYTTFAEEVEEKHEKYSVNDLKLMSMSKNPETFEKLFVKKSTSNKVSFGLKPSYLDDFEKKSSEIILQNFRLINARDKKLNGNNVQKSASNKKGIETSSKPPKLVPLTPKVQDIELPKSPTQTSVAAFKRNPKTPKSTTKQAVNGDMQEINGPLDLCKDNTNKLAVSSSDPAADLDPPKTKRKKSSDCVKEDKNTKAPNQRFLCKNNFQKGDFLIHPSQLHGKFGPVKLVTYRRETKKVFLSVSEFETKETNEDEFVVMEKSSHKNRSTPAKFLDSYVKINEYIEVIDKAPDKMTIRRMIPKTDFPCSLTNEITNQPSKCTYKKKEEIIDLDELVNDEAFDEELDELDDKEMVIDETNP